MNQPPPTETQTGKRIVSKGEYVAFRAKKAILRTGVVGGCGVALISLGAAIYLFFVGMSALLEAIASVGWNWEESAQSAVSAVLYLGLVAFLCWGAYVMGKIGETSMEQSANIEDVVPLTRANTADLPAPDTLVRASEEPRQEPQAVLLRAATETAEKHEEQLVRASAGSPQDGTETLFTH